MSSQQVSKRTRPDFSNASEYDNNTMTLLENSKLHKKCYHINCYVQNKCLIKVSLSTVTYTLNLQKRSILKTFLFNAFLWLLFLPWRL